jgi:hypothetical protein
MLHVEQSSWYPRAGWSPADGSRPLEAGLVLAFGSGPAIVDSELLAEVRHRYPAATIVGCSTAGEILGTSVGDDGLVVTAVAFEHTRVRAAGRALEAPSASRDTGARIASDLLADDLVHVFVLSEGLHVNGSELVAGLTDGLPAHVTVTGGLSADGDRFGTSYVLGEAGPVSDRVTAVGFYGDRLHVGSGSLGGWDSFGPERLITRSLGNVLYELDGRSALELYKAYLGPHAEGLPATGLLFPLHVRRSRDDREVVRTILAVDERDQSLTFAGDIPEGGYARLMKANVNRLLDGAGGAAGRALVGAVPPQLAILISCVGRKLVLKQRVEDEVEAARDVFGDAVAMTGFYSYGEISPFTPGARCELHNQTMTITTLAEV